MTSPRDDLVERLPDYSRKLVECLLDSRRGDDWFLRQEAATSIEQLEKEVERLREALNECANVLDIIVNPKSPTSSFMAWGQAIAASRRARAALNVKP
jgi:hypothetical protein